MLLLPFLTATLLAFPVNSLKNPVDHGAMKLDDFLSAAKLQRGSTSLDSLTETISSLGGESIIDCPGNSATDINDSLAARDSLLSALSAGITLDPGTCRHATAGKGVKTYAQVCNHSNATSLIDGAASTAALGLLSNVCSQNRASGTLETGSKLSFAIFATSGNEIPTRTKSRMSRTLQKRCVASTQLPVTGCEDDVCDPKIVRDSVGNCPNVGNDETDGCTYHCELRAARFYGPAKTFDDADYCAVSLAFHCHNSLCLYRYCLGGSWERRLLSHSGA